MKYPIVTYKQMCKILKRNKYHFDRYSGNHAIYIKEGHHHTPINIHLNSMVARRLIKENDLS